MVRIVQNELTSRVNEFINPEQHGFLSIRPCTTNLISLTDSISSNLYNDIGTDIIYFDFAKSFDTVNHDLLLIKLKNKFNINARYWNFLLTTWKIVARE